MRKLEDALAETHSSLSEESHPLLTDDIKRPLERRIMPNLDASKDDIKEGEGEEDVDTLVSSYGVLYVT